MSAAVVHPGRSHDSVTLLPGRSRRFALDAGVQVAADGVITLPDGGLRAILAVEPINFACRSLVEQDVLAAQFAALASSLAPGQTLQVLVESRPIDAAALLPRLFARLQPVGRAMTDFQAAYRPWLADQFARTHVPDLSFYLISAPAPVQRELGETLGSPALEAARARRALDHAVDQWRHLQGMQLEAQILRRGAVLRLLWRALHPPEDPCPPEERFPGAATEPRPADAPATARPLGTRLRELVGLAPGPALPAAVVDAFWLHRQLCHLQVEETLRSLCLHPADGGPAMYARSLCLLEPAEFTDPGWLDPLIGIGCPIRLALHLEGLDRKAERARLKRRRRSLNVLTFSATTAVRLGADEQPAINLWDGAPTAAKITFVVNAHEVLLATNPGERLDALTRAALSEGVRAVYAATAGRTPLERDLVAWLKREVGRREGAERDRFRDLAIKLSAYVEEGEAAALLDRPTSVNLEDRLVVFDLEGLARDLQPLAMFIIAECVRRRADCPRRPGEGIRELLIIDEDWFFTRYAAAQAWLDELARKTRHWGLAVIFITQKLSDLIKDPVASSLFDSASVQLLFRQRDAQSEGESPMAWLRDRLGLCKEEANRLYSLATVPGQYAEALLVRESKDSVQPRRGVVQLFCHPLEYWLFTTEALRDVPYRNAMIAALGGDVWAAVRACAAGTEVPDHPPLDDAGPAEPDALVSGR